MNNRPDLPGVVARPTRTRSSVTRRAVSAVALLVVVLAALGATASPASAAPQTDAIPLSTLGVAPQSGTLANQVGWSVNIGQPHPDQGYVFFAPLTQVWTFDRPVSLRFGIAGLTGNGECVRVPVGSVLESLAPSHTYNPATRLVCTATPVSAATSIFTLAGPTTNLSLDAVNLPGFGRGPNLIEVTYDLPNVVIDGPRDATFFEVGEIVPADFGCTPGTGAISSTVGTVPVGQPINTSTVGDFPFTVTCTDEFGATSTVTTSYSVVPVVGIPLVQPLLAAGALALVGGLAIARRRSSTTA